MDIRAIKPGQARSAEVGADIARIVSILQCCRKRCAARGPFLFGAFSIADAMYAPVVWRFVSYGAVSYTHLDVYKRQGRARRWRADRPLEGAIYTETIPFSETRDYVKKVMSNSVYYSALFDGQPQTIKNRLGVIPARTGGEAKGEDLP